MVLKQAVGLFLILGLLVTVACSGNNQNANSDQPKLPGQAIYEKTCAACHGKDGKLGLSGASDLSVSSLTEEERINIILNGRNTMVGFKGAFSDEEVKAMASYLENLRN